MHIAFLVEEPSMETFLNVVLEPLLQGRATYEIQNLRGKQRLLTQLSSRLRGFRGWAMDDLRIVVLLDRDDDDCRALKAKLESIALDAGFRTKTSDPQRFQIVNRIVVEELEAWILGDPEALRAAYPRLSPTFERRAEYRDPDAVAGGTAEALLRLFQSAGYYSAGLPKQTVAGDVARHIAPERSRSRSFQIFWRALAEMVEA